MAQYLTIARPYALAIFDIAKSDSQLQNGWERVLTILATAVAQQSLLQLLTDPGTPKRRQCEVLNSFVAEEIAQLGESVKNFISLLVEYQRLQALPDILKHYQALVAEQHNSLSMRIASAFELDESQQKKLIDALGKRFQATINPVFIVDRELIGGIRVSTDTWVMDASIKGKLNQLQASLT